MNDEPRMIELDGKQRYYEPAESTDVEAFRAVVRSRRSVRKFTADAIPPEVVDDCLDLAMLAPNSSGLQPWEFYVVRSDEKKRKLVKACMSQLAAKTAAELIVCVARTDRIGSHAGQMLREWPLETMNPLVKRYYQLIPFHYTSGPLDVAVPFKRLAYGAAGVFTPVPRGPFSKAELELWAAKSTALACENLVLAFRAHGYDTCMMEGFDEARVRKLLKLPASALPVMVVGAGVRADDGVFWPQVRFERSQFVHEV